MEASYRLRLREDLSAKGKGHSTIRNSIQGIGRYLKAFHQLQHTQPVPVVKPQIPGWRQSREVMAATSPYKHITWMTQSRYRLGMAQWPKDILDAFQEYRNLKKDSIQAVTLAGHVKCVESHLGYLSIEGKHRLDSLPPDARHKIGLKPYHDDRQTIIAPAVLSSWHDLFNLDGLKGFVTWHAWRIHTPFDAKVKERPPSKPSGRGRMVADAIQSIATTLERPEASTLRAYLSGLAHPKVIHNKSAAYHDFTFDELEQVAHALMDEARHMDISSRSNGKGPVQYPGGYAALRFQLGVVLMLGWRIPMRARNWSEMLLQTNLRHINGGWVIHFEGDELKIRTRRGEMNVFEMEIPQDCVPALEEYLNVWRPLLPHANEDRHVLLSLRNGGGMLQPKFLYEKIKTHVYRFTGKRFYLHLLRTIFTSNMLSSGMDINSVAYGLNDTPATVLKSYNEMQGAKHQQSLQEAYSRALNGNGQANGKGKTR